MYHSKAWGATDWTIQLEREYPDPSRVIVIPIARVAANTRGSQRVTTLDTRLEVLEADLLDTTIAMLRIAVITEALGGAMMR